MVEKCKVLVFTTKRVNLDRRLLYLGLEKLDEVKSFKYLGVEFHANLSFNLMRHRVIKKRNREWL